MFRNLTVFHHVEKVSKDPLRTWKILVTTDTSWKSPPILAGETQQLKNYELTSVRRTFQLLKQHDQPLCFVTPIILFNWDFIGTEAIYIIQAVGLD